MATSTAKAREPRNGRRTASSLLVALGVALAPKCPLCVAAWLTGLGLSAHVAKVSAPLVFPVALLLAASMLVALGLSSWRARRSTRSRPCCHRLDSPSVVQP